MPAWEFQFAAARGRLRSIIDFAYLATYIYTYVYIYISTHMPSTYRLAALPELCLLQRLQFWPACLSPHVSTVNCSSWLRGGEEWAWGTKNFSKSFGLQSGKELSALKSERTFDKILRKNLLGAFFACIFNAKGQQKKIKKIKNLQQTTQDVMGSGRWGVV